MYAIYANIGVVLGVNVGIYGSPMGRVWDTMNESCHFMSPFVRHLDLFERPKALVTFGDVGDPRWTFKEDTTGTRKSLPQELDLPQGSQGRTVGCELGGRGWPCLGVP